MSVLKSVDELLEDPGAFYCALSERLSLMDIDTRQFPISQVAYRCRTFREYLRIRDGLELHAAANVESVWNGRPISKVLLREPLLLSRHVTAELVELIPPFHKRQFRIGLEHIAFVVGERVDEFAQQHRDVLSGQQHQGVVSESCYVRFDDQSHVKFCRESLRDICEQDGHRFDRIVHADWEPADIDAGPYEV